MSAPASHAPEKGDELLAARLALFDVAIRVDPADSLPAGASPCASRRTLIATRDMPPGTLILQSLPHSFAVLPLPTAAGEERERNRCEWCAAVAGDESDAPAPVKLSRCSRCKRSTYCSAACQRAAWSAFHSFECSRLWGSAAASQLLDRLAPEARLDLILLGRCVRTRQKAIAGKVQAGSTDEPLQQQLQLEHEGAPLHSTQEDLAGLESHYTFLAQTVEAHGKPPAPDATSTPLSDAAVLSMAQRLTDNTQLLAVGFRAGVFGPSVSPDDLTPLLLPLLTAFQTNNFALTNGLLVTHGAGVYPLGALLNHSCKPNCVISYEARRKGDPCDPRAAAALDAANPYSAPYEHIQSIRTTRRVHAGEELTHSYTDVCATTRARRHQLADRYYFHCRCARCSRDEQEGDLQPETAFERFLERDGDGRQLPDAILDYSDCGADSTSSDLPPARLAALQQANRLWREATQIHLEANTATTDADYAAEEARRTRLEQSLLEQALQLRLQHLHPHCVQVMATYSSLLQAALLNADFAAAAQACLQLCRRYHFAYGDDDFRRDELDSIARGQRKEADTSQTADRDQLLSSSTSLPFHPLLGLQLYTLGSIYAELKDGRSARLALQRALDILMMTHGDRHPMVRKLAKERDRTQPQ